MISSGISADSFDAARVYSDIAEGKVNSNDVQSWAEDRLLQGKRSEARAGFRAVVGERYQTLPEAHLSREADVAWMEMHAYFSNGYLQEGLEAYGVFKAYAEKVELPQLPIPAGCFLECGDRCLVEKRYPQAIESYKRAKCIDRLKVVHTFAVRRKDQDTVEAAREALQELGVSL